MTAYRFVTLACDVCGEISDGGTDRTVRAARATAKAEGWKRNGQTDGCPRHHGYYWCEVGGWTYDPALAERFSIHSTRGAAGVGIGAVRETVQPPSAVRQDGEAAK